MARKPQEMDAGGEFRDKWKPLGGVSWHGSSGLRSPRQGIYSPIRFSEGSVDSLGSSSPLGETPTLEPSGVARVSVMSEIPRDST